MARPPPWHFKRDQDTSADGLQLLGVVDGVHNCRWPAGGTMGTRPQPWPTGRCWWTTTPGTTPTLPLWAGPWPLQRRKPGRSTGILTQNMSLLCLGASSGEHLPHCHDPTASQGPWCLGNTSRPCALVAKFCVHTMPVCWTVAGFHIQDGWQLYASGYVSSLVT